METIVVYFSPLVSTKVLGAIGLSLAYHMAIVYTDANGMSFGASSGPSKPTTPQTPALALSALVDSAFARPSAFGLLVADPKNNHPFLIGLPEDYYTQDFNGDPYPSIEVMRGENLSATWGTILRCYADIGGRRLTYSPMTQNSNSMAGNALRRAGLRMPFSKATKFAPAEFTELP